LKQAATDLFQKKHKNSPSLDLKYAALLSGERLGNGASGGFSVLPQYTPYCTTKSKANQGNAGIWQNFFKKCAPSFEKEGAAGSSAVFDADAVKLP
jgi:hypothetical protein